MRLTQKHNFRFIKDIRYFPSDSLAKKPENEIAAVLLNKVGETEDIEDLLKKLTFYGKVYQYPNKLMPLQFNKIYYGGDYKTDLRIEFKLKNGLGNVFYNIFEYGKVWSLNKEDLL